MSLRIKILALIYVRKVKTLAWEYLVSQFLWGIIHSGTGGSRILQTYIPITSRAAIRFEETFCGLLRFRIVNHFISVIS